MKKDKNICEEHKEEQKINDQPENEQKEGSTDKIDEFS